DALLLGDEGDGVAQRERRLALASSHERHALRALDDPLLLGEDRDGESLDPFHVDTRFLGDGVDAVTGAYAGLDLPRCQRTPRPGAVAAHQRTHMLRGARQS